MRFDIDTFREIGDSLMRNKRRSLLTGFGVFWGLFMLLFLIGGGARSKLWSEIVGYVTGCEIYRMEEPETCCVGAAMTAFCGLGVFETTPPSPTRD